MYVKQPTIPNMYNTKITVPLIPISQFVTLLFLMRVHCHENYCNPKLCEKGVRHVACDAGEAFRSTCPNNSYPFLVTMDAELRSQIVDTHNYYRSHVAVGNLDGFKSATNMMHMVRCPESACVTPNITIRLIPTSIK